MQTHSSRPQHQLDRSSFRELAGQRVAYLCNLATARVYPMTNSEAALVESNPQAWVCSSGERFAEHHPVKKHILYGLHVLLLVKLFAVSAQRRTWVVLL